MLRCGIKGSLAHGVRVHPSTIFRTYRAGRGLRVFLFDRINRMNTDSFGR